MMPLWRQVALAQRAPHPPDWTRAFGRSARLEVDLGCGRGTYALERARRCPDWNVLALDTRKKWIEEIRASGRSLGLTNLKAIRCDVAWDLPVLFARGSVTAFCLHHPDPWWKKRHRKRRLIQAAFVQLVSELLQPEGWFFLQSDVFEYVSEMAGVFAAHPAFESMDGDEVKRELMLGIPSHRERRCLQAGISVERAAFRRRGA